ncbi:MAG: hypothetical protein B6241_09340 [Spirochaetaceae bacterium 4572_59]|nr:MAG: hypothetical protein B6241_09340 [Spirochaetaceae bacterium 4572_59]
MNLHIILIIAAIVILLLIKYWNFFLFVMGLQALKKGQYEKAVKYIKTASQSGMKAKHKLTCGYVLLTRGLIEEADTILKPLLGTGEKRFSHKEARIYYSLLQWQKGELNSAVEALENLMKEGYITTILYTNLGFYLIEQGELQKALELNLEAHEYNDSSKGIMDNLGLNYIKLGEWEKAVPLYEKLMKTEPTFPEAYFHSAQVLSQQGKQKEALETLTKGLQQRFTCISTVQKDSFMALKQVLEA